MNAQINELRKDIGKFESIKNKSLKKEVGKDRLYKKYKVESKSLKVVLEELKQRVIAKSEKIKRYESRINQYQQNRMFSNNQKMLFEKIEGIERNNDIIPEADEAKHFWREIWEKEIEHNDQAEWISSVENEVNIRTEKQNELSINVEAFKKQARKLPNWKSPGPDGVQGFWIKN